MRQTRPGGRTASALSVLAGVLVATTLSGCSLLFGGAYPFPDDEFPQPSQVVSFSTGHATIAIEGGDTIELAQIDDSSGIESFIGSNVRWTNDDGWSLVVSGAGAEMPDGFPAPEMAYVTMDWIDGSEHRTTYDPGRCIVDVDVADETGLRGSATCRGVAWYSAVGGLGLDPPEKLDEPAFDAEITFEAAP